MTILAQLISVTKTYGQGAAARRVLDGADLAIAAGESLAILGPSGCGKSTTLNLLGGLDRPDAGQVLVDGKDLVGLDEKASAAFRNTRIGFIFQDHHLLPHLTVRENVLLPTLAAHRAPPAESVTYAQDLLAKVGLGDRGGEWPRNLSGGERQRVAVVRALINRPPLLLADEPTGALDRKTAQEIADLLLRLNTDLAVALVVVTHSLDLARRCQRVVELVDGRFVSQ